MHAMTNIVRLLVSYYNDGTVEAMVNGVEHSNIEKERERETQRERRRETGRERESEKSRESV